MKSASKIKKKESVSKTAKGKKDKLVQERRPAQKVLQKKKGLDGKKVEQGKKRKPKPALPASNRRRARGPDVVKERESLEDYFYAELYESEDCRKNVGIFYLPLEAFQIPVMCVVRKCSFIAKRILNEESFQPYEQVRNIKIPLCEVIVFEEDFSDEQLDAVYDLNIVRHGGAKLVMLMSKGQVNSYMQKVKELEE